VALALVAPGCAESEPAPAPDAPRPLDISAPAALLERIRQPGTRDRIELCRQLLEDYPDSPQAEEALYLLGQAYQSLNRHEEAAARFRDLVTRYPAGEFNAAAHPFLWAYARKVEGDEAVYRAAVERAIEDLRSRLEANPGEWTGEIGMHLATAHCEIEDWDGALEVYGEIASRPEPEEARAAETRVQARFYAAEIHRRLDRLDAAAAAYEASLELLSRAEPIDPARRRTLEANIRERLQEIRAPAQESESSPGEGSR